MMKPEEKPKPRDFRVKVEPLPEESEQVRNKREQKDECN